MIAGVFISNLPNHDVLFAGAMSGDEGYTMSRALRVREIVRGAPISLYGYVVAFNGPGRSSYVTAATVLQVIAGPTPYALRLLNTLLFTLGALLLFRLSRRSFGFVPALAGLAAVLGWPSLFAWSISLLKESLSFLLRRGRARGIRGAATGRHVARAPARISWRRGISRADAGSPPRGDRPGGGRRDHRLRAPCGPALAADRRRLCRDCRGHGRSRHRHSRAKRAGDWHTEGHREDTCWSRVHRWDTITNCSTPVST